jgi:DNA repair exonuclease SbcCD ATPase subunit
MIINAIRVAHFRGVRGELDIPLNAQISILEAHNGTGKSSVCDSIEWAILGTIRRLQPYATQERLSNLWAGSSETPHVEFTFSAIDTNTSLATYRREVDPSSRPLSPLLHLSRKRWTPLPSSEMQRFDQTRYQGGPPKPDNARTTDPRIAWFSAARIFSTADVKTYIDDPEVLDPTTKDARRDLLATILNVEEAAAEQRTLSKLFVEVEKLVRRAKKEVEDATAEIATAENRVGMDISSDGESVGAARLAIERLAEKYLNVGEWPADTGEQLVQQAAAIEAKLVAESFSRGQKLNAVARLKQAEVRPGDLGPETTGKERLADAQAATRRREGLRDAERRLQVLQAELNQLRARLPQWEALQRASEAANAECHKAEAEKTTEDVDGLRRLHAAAAAEVSHLEEALASVNAWYSELYALWARRDATASDGDCPLCGHAHGGPAELRSAVEAHGERALGEAGAAVRTALDDAMLRLRGAGQRLESAEATIRRVDAATKLRTSALDAWDAEAREMRSRNLRLPPQPDGLPAFQELLKGVDEEVSAAHDELDAGGPLPPNDNDVKASEETAKQELKVATDARSNADNDWRAVAGDVPYRTEELERIQRMLREELDIIEGHKHQLSQAMRTLRASSAMEELTHAKRKRDDANAYRKALERRLTALKEARDIRQSDIDRISRARLEALRPAIEALYRRNCLASVWQGIDAIPHSSGGLQWIVSGEKSNTPAPRLSDLKDLSAGQRQDLALAVFLAQARELGGTFVLDDPFLHLDGWNRLSYVDVLRTMVVESLRGDRKPLRFLITTANAELARLFREKFTLVRHPRHGEAGDDVSPVFRHLRLWGNPKDGTHCEVVFESGVSMLPARST